MRYIFHNLERIKNNLKGKHLFLFLDCDGTLAPIAGAPEAAVIPPDTKKILSLLLRKRNCSIAVISGRAVSDVKRIFRLKNIIYSGNHGLQIEGPKIKRNLPVPASYRKILQRIKARIKQRLSGIKGVLLEDKKLSLALHFRLAAKRQLTFIKDAFRESIIPYSAENKIKTSTGKKVFEVRPPLDWDKGKVVLWLLAKLAQKRKDILPVYIGDDLTDEDAFRALRSKGLTVFVGSPGKSSAGYYLRDTREVAEFLRLIKDLKQ
ncbi:MAG: trehalose-phosphatase [Candidatus Omnitrophica bacterium]|nr:trehalose-phosphatase [Candidatus Omnitrophota bacterium]